ncbi:MAG: LacI family DNA-binding transcriptional regulator [Chloroflexi bacterium]|uniref:LacI family DNA-binding transcriptional regulator n=1 Tax=Candidatus Chlorohelix allophototropha TaxID=3003348 RepID=A0A8T7MAD3_9CHLR|nr:LacI family DNA-binding transcriptional regulator [Chloroflexota bacterium]WJW68915.1 LacI family transcriptional regulator [Chloroflexota bacterium L227-S17]
MAVTIREVADRAGVSTMTVSRVLNDSNRVQPETRQKVERAIAELGYVPNGLARGLSSQKTGVVALIVPDVANPFFTKLVRGAENVAWHNGFRAILCNTENDLNREKAYLQDMTAQRVEGLIIAPTSDQTRQHLKALEQHNIPVVMVDRSVEGLEYDLVEGDNQTGARRLVEHLISLGHRNIAFINGPLNISTSRDRLKGYRQALEAAQLSYKSELVIQTKVDQNGGYQAAKKILKLKERPDAIFAVNNLVAVGVVQAAEEIGLAIPKNLALVCFDDIEYASIICPFLTVMAQPAESFGTIALQLLLDRISGRAIEQRHVTLAAELIIRESCGAKLAKNRRKEQP